MSIQLAVGIAAQHTTHHLAFASDRIARSAEKIASGRRVASASDDAASLTVSQKLRAQIGGAMTAQRNAQLGIGMLQTADGALQKVHNLLHRLRELATQAATDVMTNADRAALDIEVQQLGRGIDAIGQNTVFNGHHLLMGPPPARASALDAASELQVGMTISSGGGSPETAVIAVVDVSGAYAGETYSLSRSGHRVTLTRASDSASEQVDLDDIGAGGSDTIAFSTLGISISVTSAGGISKTNLAKAFTDPANDTLTMAPATTPSGQVIGVGPAAGDMIVVPFEDVSVSALGLSGALAAFSSGRRMTDAQALIASVGTASDSVSSIRARLGTMQNRIEHIVSFLGTQESDFTASYSRIVDADVPREAAKFTAATLVRETNAVLLMHLRASERQVLALLG